jgi:hypothetical protein
MVYYYSYASNRYEILRLKNGEEYVMRLKYIREEIPIKYYDGIRVRYDVLPKGWHCYQTRHSDNSILRPVSVVPEGQEVIVNFCGTIITKRDLNIKEETKITVWDCDHIIHRKLWRRLGKTKE